MKPGGKPPTSKAANFWRRKKLFGEELNCLQQRWWQQVTLVPNSELIKRECEIHIVNLRLVSDAFIYCYFCCEESKNGVRRKSFQMWEESSWKCGQQWGRAIRSLGYSEKVTSGLGQTSEFLHFTFSVYLSLPFSYICISVFMSQAIPCLG